MGLRRATRLQCLPGDVAMERIPYADGNPVDRTVFVAPRQIAVVRGSLSAAIDYTDNRDAFAVTLRRAAAEDAAD
jgi:hypothetical protein